MAAKRIAGAAAELFGGFVVARKILVPDAAAIPCGAERGVKLAAKDAEIIRRVNGLELFKIDTFMIEI